MSTEISAIDFAIGAAVGTGAINVVPGNRRGAGVPRKCNQVLDLLRRAFSACEFAELNQLSLSRVSGIMRLLAALH